MQRRVYEAVLGAADAARAGWSAGHRVPRGARRRHGGHRTQDGRVGVPAGRCGESARRRPAEHHRRYMVHGFESHHLGIDVHDCARRAARLYLDGEVKEMVFTIEPGLYFQPDDLTVPEEYRGGIRSAHRRTASS
ncbi:MAG: M24 family metallopeptidase [Schumannella sp.]